MAENNQKNREELLKIIQAYTDISCADQEAMADVLVNMILRFKRNF